MRFQSNGVEEMKLLDRVEPVMPDGHYRARAVQTVAVGGGPEQEYTGEVDFHVAGRAFTLPMDSVFSVSPQENARGNFEKELPFVVLSQKSFPWQYHMGGTPPRPWVALLVLGEEDGAAERDLTVEELLAHKGEEGVFFPVESQPEQFVESPEDICHVVELPVKLYQDLMPRPEETPYLCHAKYVNLARTEEKVSGMDGFFSVVIANRFVPSGEEEMKSTVHLVSLLGCEGADLSGYQKVRLCSLYHWNIFSRASGEPGFGELIRGLDCREFGRKDTDHPLLRRGVTAMEHRLRTGETTGSLYASPLAPGQVPLISMPPRHTADGYMIYDKNKGVFDVRYACAWQLGRMAVLADEAAAQQIVRWRRRMAEGEYMKLLGADMQEELPDFTAAAGKIRAVLEGRDAGKEPVERNGKETGKKAEGGRI